MGIKYIEAKKHEVRIMERNSCNCKTLKPLCANDFGHMGGGVRVKN